MAHTVSVGISRVFRLVLVDAGYRIEQAVQELSPLGTGKKEWTWVPLAFAQNTHEAHGALHQMQADFLDKMIERQGSFRGDKSH